ncbi:MAG: SurA N-terminal domain-containing protein [Myxococcaceae bacterium]
MTKALVVVALAAAPVFAQSAVIDRVAVVVDDHPILRSQVEERLKADGARAEQDQQTALAKARMGLVDDWLIARDAKRDVTIDDAQVESALNEVGKSNQIDRAQLEAAVKAQGLTMPLYREMLRTQLLQMRWVMLRQAQSGAKLPADSAERAKAFDDLKRKLLDALRKRAVIEVYE